MTTEPSHDKKSRHDPLLEMWVGIAEESSVGFSVTLLMSGILVSGTIVSSSRFYELFYEELASAMKQNAIGSEGFESFGETVVKFPMLLREQTIVLEQDIEIDYIHLSDVTIMPTLAAPTLQRGYWRGRLDSVDGWILGAVTISNT